jgi:two-component system response regulator AtoC
VDIRLVAATNKDFKEEIKQNRFRQDLFFRLNVIHIRMPALREIRSDIPLLATYFLRKYNKEMGRDIQGLSQDATKALMAYHWPGNVRELENEIKRAVVLAAGREIQVQDLSDPIREERLAASDADSPKKSGEKQTLKDRVTTLEIQMIRDAMGQTGSDRRRAAKILGLSHQGLINKLKRYGLED